MNELRVNFQGVATIYAVIRRLSDSYVFNGSTFEVWNDANIATYKVALSNAGGDLYSASMPTAIGSGDYRATYYQQAGGSPAIADYIVGIPKELHWDGAAASSVSTVTLSAYALTTLDGLKRHLRITDSADDTLLTEVINQVSAMIESIVGRKFVARDYRERRNGEWQRRLMVDQYPIQGINRVAFGAGNAMHLSFTGSAIRANCAYYRPDSLDASGGLRLVSINAAGVRAVTSLSFASYPSTSALATAVIAVSGWSATADANIPSADLNPVANGNCLGRMVYLTYPDVTDYDYTYDAERGMVEFSRVGNFYWPDSAATYQGGYSDRLSSRPCNEGFQNFLIEYNAGYTTVPDDVDLVCRELCAEKYYGGLDNPGVKSTSMGPYSTTFGYSDQDMIRQRLSTYIDGRNRIGGV